MSTDIHTKVHAKYSNTIFQVMSTGLAILYKERARFARSLLYPIASHYRVNLKGTLLSTTIAHARRERFYWKGSFIA